MLTVTALDVGGANIKAVDHAGRAYCWPFALWKKPEGLAPFLATKLAHLGSSARLAVTMTGELCDAYASKSEGVRAITGAVREGARGLYEEVLVWRADGRFASLEAVEEDPLPAAAANWLALAELAARILPELAALVVDVGSTTSDLVPIRNGRPAPQGRTDTERLLSRELVYTGVTRTPVASIVRELPLHGDRCPVSSELFATTKDVYLILGDLAEDAGDHDTADGRTATYAYARQRLARMLCADAHDLGEADVRRAAEHVRRTQVDQLRDAARRVLARTPAAAAVISGSGEFLAREVLEPFSLEVVPLSRHFGSGASIAVCAYAVRELVIGSGR